MRFVRHIKLLLVRVVFVPSRQKGNGNAPKLVNMLAQLRRGFGSVAAARTECFAISLGSVTSNRAPPYCGSDDADSLPPCCSMIILQIARPNPVPFAFVVTNGIKNSCQFVGVNSGACVLQRNGN